MSNHHPSTGSLASQPASRHLLRLLFFLLHVARRSHGNIDRPAGQPARRPDWLVCSVCASYDSQRELSGPPICLPREILRSANYHVQCYAELRGWVSRAPLGPSFAGRTRVRPVHAEIYGRVARGFRPLSPRPFARESRTHHGRGTLLGGLSAGSISHCSGTPRAELDAELRAETRVFSDPFLGKLTPRDTWSGSRLRRSNGIVLAYIGVFFKATLERKLESKGN